MTAASVSFSDFNAWTDPWVPVTGHAAPGSGSGVVSLRDVLARGHEFTDLGASLYPLAREALLRLLVSTAAVGLAHASNNDVDDFGYDGLYPPDALGHLDTLTDRFALRHPHTPFLQAWDYTPDPADEPLPLTSLDPHTPGPTASRWAARRGRGATSLTGSANADTPAAVALALTVTWFHSKWSNSAAPTGMVKTIAGSPGYSSAKDLTFHWLGTNLGLTIAAGIPLSWTEPGPCSHAAWLDQDHYPSGADLTGDPTSLWRATYTPNRPILTWPTEPAAEPGGDAPTGYLIGCVAGAGRPIPAIAPPARASKAPLSTEGKPGEASPYTKAVIGGLHARDITRAYRDLAKPGETPNLRQVTSTTHRLLSAEAATVWFTAHNAADLATWGGNRVAPAHAADPAWRLGCYLEESNHSKRTTSAWVVIDPAMLTITGPAGDAVVAVLKYARKAQSLLRGHVRVALAAAALGDLDPTVDRAIAKGSALEGAVTQSGTDFYAALDDVVLTMLTDAAAGTMPDIAATCRTIAATTTARYALDAAPLRTPGRIPLIEATRASLGRCLHRALPRTERPAAVPVEQAAA